MSSSAERMIDHVPDRTVELLGVDVTDVTRQRAVGLINEAIDARRQQPLSVFFVNAHTLNLATADEQFRQLLNQADYVYGDGTGVRWAARLKGIRVRDNLVGTDLTPLLLQSAAGRGRTYFMLGGDDQTVEAAGNYSTEQFPGWKLLGTHHGFLTSPGLVDEAIEKINACSPDVLLVGMGNPLQEQWVHQNRDRLNVRVCLAIGGLYDYWAGNVSRAPGWLRRIGHEWMWRLFQQPRDKARRYLIGNPLFLYRIFRDRLRRRRR